jgi:hypothetical protein
LAAVPILLHFHDIGNLPKPSRLWVYGFLARGLRDLVGYQGVGDLVGRSVMATALP